MPKSNEKKQEAKGKFNRLLGSILRLPENITVSGADEIIDLIVEAAVIEALGRVWAAEGTVNRKDAVDWLKEKGGSTWFAKEI